LSLTRINGFSMRRSVQTEPSESREGSQVSESGSDAVDGAFHRRGSVKEVVVKTVTTIGLDIAKSVFQVHGVDAEGKALSASN